MTQATLHSAKRMVLKIGSLLLIDEATGALNAPWLAALAEDIAALRAMGKEVILVSSGAIALGRPELGFTHHELSLPEKQAAAACGQMTLAQAWQDALRTHALNVAQMLLTAEDTEDRRRYLNARSTIETLLSAGAVPIINENDSIMTEEIRYGDNDRLAARVAAMASADLLILLSDIDGLYDADPKVDSAAKLIPVVEQLDERVWAMAGESRDHRASGGMKTKLQAAEMAIRSGCHMIIARGTRVHPIRAILEGGTHSWFRAESDPVSARKQWIANAVHVAGALTIDAGAEKALRTGKSLLPAGVSQVEGTFARGDTVRICNQSGGEIALGLSAYASDAAAQIAGKHSEEIEAILGYKGRDALVHRDDMVLMS